MNSPQLRYEIIGTLGTGASSRVDKARDSTIGRTVAVKTFLHGFGSGDLQKQFLREAQIIGRLTHPNIVSLYDVGTNTDGVPYLVMEYVEGKTLERTLDAGPLPLERAAVWATDLASALARAHQCKIIHGDVKPANVLITAEGQVKLGDFGIARFATQVSGSGNILGTPAYLSPEQILGHKQDTRSDLFSLGIILYQMTTGVRPFDGTSVGAVCAQIISAEPVPPSHHNSALPLEFDHLVLRCLSKDPALRYADAQSLAASLYPFARSKPLAMPPPSPFWWKRPVQSSDLRAFAGVLVALAVLGAGARAVHQHFSAPTTTPVAQAQGFPSLSIASAPDGVVASRTRLGSDSAAPLIKVAMTDVSGENVSAAGPSFTPLNAQDLTAAQPMVDLSAQNGSTAFSGADADLPFPSVSHVFERRAVVSPKSKTIGSASEPLAPGRSSASSPAAAAKSFEAAAKSGSTPLAKTSLHVDIVSGVVDETISIFSGEQLLLSTPLEAAHLGDTLRFDCPVTPGEHSFRVVVFRADDTVVVEKGSISQIHSDASNFLGIHVSRRAKLLFKHETALEIVWPSAPAPVVASTSPRPMGELALR
jgi:serine/threonine protein kinase